MDPNRKSQIAIQRGLSPRCTGEDMSARSGPVTPHGKSRSSRNSVRHGLLARNLLLDRESTNRFNLLANDLYDEFQPATPAECAAVDTMIWVSAGLIPSPHRRGHVRPVRTLERSLVDAEIRRTPEPATDLPGNDGCNRAAQAFRTLAERTSTLNVRNLYETSFDRQYTRALRRLVLIRQARNRQKEVSIPNEPTEVLYNQQDDSTPEPENASF